jgi:hypothetical protein
MIMIDWNNLPPELQIYRGWFVEAHSREPKTLYELAVFLDDERGRGMFANAGAVDEMYHIARAERHATEAANEMRKQLERSTPAKLGWPKN